MADRQLGKVLQHVRRLVARPIADETSDAALLSLLHSA